MGLAKGGPGGCMPTNRVHTWSSVQKFSSDGLVVSILWSENLFNLDLDLLKCKALIPTYSWNGGAGGPQHRSVVDGGGGGAFLRRSSWSWERKTFCLTSNTKWRSSRISEVRGILTCSFPELCPSPEKRRFFLILLISTEMISHLYIKWQLKAVWTRSLCVGLGLMRWWTGDFTLQSISEEQTKPPRNVMQFLTSAHLGALLQKKLWPKTSTENWMKQRSC